MHLSEQISFVLIGLLFCRSLQALSEYLYFAERRNSMAKVKLVNASEKKKKLRPALTPESRENQLISLAIDLAEQQLMDGTASSQVITHYLKLGSSKERIEKEILEKQKDLISAKTEALQSAKKIEELYANAINAMKSYSGQNHDEDGEDY